MVKLTKKNLFELFLIFYKYFFIQLLGRDKKTHADKWKHRHTFLHIGLLKVTWRTGFSGRYLIACILTTLHTERTTSSPQLWFWCLRWVEQYSTNVAGKVVLRCSVFKYSVWFLSWELLSIPIFFVHTYYLFCSFMNLSN